jgi:hypothetical protein
MRRLVVFAVILSALLLLLPVIAQAQQKWSGVIATSRAIAWTNAGLTATLPDGETTPNPWTPPTRSTICTTLTTSSFPGMSSSNPVAPTALNTAIQNCGTGQVVYLSAGSYYFNSTFYDNGGNQCRGEYTLRGAGADQTKIYISGSISPAMTCFNESSGTNSWSAGYAQGATSITLASNPGTGVMLELQQCDTGWSGPSCTTGATLDNGQEWVCTDDGRLCAHSQGPHPVPGTRDQLQTVYTTAVSGRGPYTVTISPGLYMDNWTSRNSPTAVVITITYAGIGWEDLSVDFTGSSSVAGISMADCYDCWYKGIRVIGGTSFPQEPIINILSVQHVLVSNNYTYAQSCAYHSSSSWYSDVLWLNNIWDNGCALQSLGYGGEDQVNGYNFSHAIQLLAASADYFAHGPGTSFNLYEGNEGFSWQDDDNHGTHALDTVYRNWLSDANTGQSNGLYAVTVGQGTRFVNVIGNVLGSSNASVYQCVPASCSGANGIYQIGIGGEGVGFMNDAVSLNSLFRWGNYDTINAAVQWNSSDVPSGLNAAQGFTQGLGTGNGSNTTFSGTLAHTPCVVGNTVVFDARDSLWAYDNGSGTFINNASAGSVNCTTGAISVTFTSAPANGAAVTVDYLQQTSTASAYQNPVPSSHTLPNSFFLTGRTTTTGGTGLSWWKVCTNYPTCSTSQTPPFPAIGPDVAGGNGPGGYAYDIPAAIAWKNLPVDRGYQNSYSISSARVSGSGPYTVTLTVVGLPSSPTAWGEFTISGASPSTYNGTYTVSASSRTQIVYTTSSNPGTYSSRGNVGWPNIRTFNEKVYENDSTLPQERVAVY